MLNNNNRFPITKEFREFYIDGGVWKTRPCNKDNSRYIINVVGEVTYYHVCRLNLDK